MTGLLSLRSLLRAQMGFDGSPVLTVWVKLYILSVNNTVYLHAKFS